MTMMSKLLFFAFAMLIICFHASFAQQDDHETKEDDEGPEEDVIVLTDTNFDVETKQGAFFIFFSAPWCAHCKRLAHIWEDAAAQTRGQVVFAKVDCTVETGLSKRFNIKSYPTLKFFRDNITLDYHDERTVDALVGFSQMMLQPSISPVSLATFNSWTNKFPVLFIYFGSRDAPEMRTYEHVSRVFQGKYIFLHADDDYIPSQEELTRLTSEEDDKTSDKSATAPATTTTSTASATTAADKSTTESDKTKKRREMLSVGADKENDQDERDEDDDEDDVDDDEDETDTRSKTSRSSSKSKTKSKSTANKSKKNAKSKSHTSQSKSTKKGKTSPRRSSSGGQTLADLFHMQQHLYESGAEVVSVRHGFEPEVLGSGWSAPSLRRFVETHALPLISDLNPHSFQDLSAIGRLVVFGIMDPTKTEQSHAYLELFRKVAHEYRSAFVFATVDSSKYGKYVEQFGVTADSLPTIMVLDYPNEQFFTRDVVHVETINDMYIFLDDVLTGKNQPKGTHAWWSPIAAYVKLQKYLSTFSETQLMWMTIVIMILFAIFLVIGCKYALTNYEGETGTPRAAPVILNAPASGAGHEKTQ
eukprot:TRINITY_DN1370_c0_g1_i1.p1 TRINITY_DN1370_c0_g1~~TRINITY_DN1370_c0_g1_i1.p1  ORF type:complete len:588 (+),score=146.10 TRINITY_DN1370_c0_g1_i1:63-1826(+)